MSSLEFEGSQGALKDNRASQIDQPTEENVYPPFAEKLSVDEELKLSKKEFKQTIYDFYKNITPLSQLTSTPPFPTPHVLAQFASKAYEDYKTEETDEQYETRLKLPDGWKLLTTASNGYFGAAYWHREHQQVVIAHRGTEPTNLSALWTDYRGVSKNQYVSQMCSASTFTHKVVEVLREVNEEKGISFQLFFTGHSLGGWLAQVTTFTTEYLKTEGYYFQRNNNDQNCYHPHTVVFDSPGCKEMLSQMRDTFDLRVQHDGPSIDIEHLDITSYLSAPNRFNTCNKLVGTVYRIFPDLSDMGWKEKNTPLFTIATHRMQKIVKAFDPETGQVLKDGQGQLKVKVVTDWPISAGLFGGEEYNNFFKRAEHLNNYHPDSKEEILQLKGYHPLRYQTKTYDERVSNLRVFCQQEQQFLESYFWLRQLPEFFKPKELFAVMGNIHVQNEAERILQSFEIENDTIRCTDGSALQALIPYVKRLLQRFPKIRENTKNALSIDGVRTKVYQFETRRCVEQISQSPLDFKWDALSFRDFLKDEQQRVLQIKTFDADEWTGLIMVYRVLKNADYLSEGQYTVLKLKRLLTVNQLMDFSKLMQSIVTPYLLLMECDANKQLNDEAEYMITRLFSTIKDNPYIKVILSTRSEGTTVLSLQQIGREIFGKAFVARDKQLTWSDIIKSSQEKLLEKSVIFQGAKISLNKLMSVESAAANFLPLGALLEDKEHKIADPVPIANTYNEDYYIRRNLCRQHAIKEDILWDICKKKIPDFLVTTEEEFKQVCQNNPKENVHFLQEDKTGKLLWQQSQGSLATLRRYIDTDSSHTYTADDLVKLLEQGEHERVKLISDTAGMGKSTVLTHLSKQIKQKFPAKWVVRIDLNDHADALNALKQEQIGKEKAIEFVSEKLLKLKRGLELELFKQCFEEKQKVRIVIMVDGFDEISPFYKETVIDMLQALRQTAVEQLWVTTRPHLKEKLEDTLQQLSYTLEPFSEENKVEFLRKIWSLKDWFTVVGNAVEEGKSKLEIFAKELCTKVGQSISDKDKDFTGVPLQCRMLAEAFEEEVKAFYLSPDFVSDVTFKIDLPYVYEKFIERKFNIYQEEKNKAQMSNVITIEQRGLILKRMRKDHQLPALKVLFNEEQVKSFEIYSECTFSNEELTRMGIAELKDEGKMRFIHRTFAEFFVSDFFVNQLRKGNRASRRVQECLFKDIFLKAEYRVVRAFIDGSLSKSGPSEEELKHYGNRITDTWKDSVLILYHAAVEDNANIVGFLLESLQVAGHKDNLIQLLEAQHTGRQTAWHVAGMWGNLKVLQKLWDWAKEKELHRKYLLARDSKGKTVWHVAAEQGKLEILRQLWEWATAEKLNDKLLLARDVNEQTFLHVATESANTKEYEKLWDWATAKLTAERLKESLLAKDHNDLTVFNVAANRTDKGVFQKLWKYAEAELTPEDIQSLFTYRR